MIYLPSKFNDNFFKYMKYSFLKNGCDTKKTSNIFVYSLFKKIKYSVVFSK